MWGRYSCRSYSGRGDGMRWRVLMELTGPDGGVRLEEVVAGGERAVDPLADSPIGLTLAEGKASRGNANDECSSLSPFRTAW
jgi:hypothetical protein